MRPRRYSARFAKKEPSRLFRPTPGLLETGPGPRRSEGHWTNRSDRVRPARPATAPAHRTCKPPSWRSRTVQRRVARVFGRKGSSVASHRAHRSGFVDVGEATVRAGRT